MFISPSLFIVTATELSTISCDVPLRFCSTLLLTLGTRTTSFRDGFASSWIVVYIITKFFIIFATVLRLDAVARISVISTTLLLTFRTRTASIYIRHTVNNIPVVIVAFLLVCPIAFKDILLHERRFEVPESTCRVKVLPFGQHLPFRLKMLGLE